MSKLDEIKALTLHMGEVIDKHLENAGYEKTHSYVLIVVAGNFRNHEVAMTSNMDSTNMVGGLMIDTALGMMSSQEEVERVKKGGSKQ